MTWCILRMSSARTLNVVSALRVLGIEVWTPAGARRRYKPRSHKFTDQTVALLPSFAFARIEDLGRLLAISHSPAFDISFTVLQRADGRTPTASNAALQPLREFEMAQRSAWEGFVEKEAREAKQKRKKTSARAYVMGQHVRVNRPAFAGLVGEIVKIKNNGDLVLEFTGFTRGTTVPACDVQSIHLSAEQSEQDKAA